MPPKENLDAVKKRLTPLAALMMLLDKTKSGVRIEWDPDKKD